MNTKNNPEVAIGTARWWLLALLGVACGGITSVALFFIIGKVWLWLV